VAIEDDGIPFNPLEKETPDTDLPLEERKIGGLGIHLVRNLMDKVSYQRRVDKNRLTLVKNISK
jgi:anti-sigma regulatory factor (Ser/Thr protein kinase)